MMIAPALAPTRARKQHTNRSTATTWTPEEDDRLRKMVEQSESVSWCAIARYFPNKTAPQIAGRWEKVLNPKLIKGSWTREEDQTIVEFVNRNGDRDWAKLALLLQGRTGKQCRERYKNHLDTSVQKTPWTPEDDQKLIQLHSEYGNAWTKIASFFDGKTDNCVKNRWNSTIKKKLDRMQKGEPLVMKRGRKPKRVSEIPVPDIPSDDSISSSQEVCSSPITAPQQLIELAINDHFAIGFRSTNTSHEPPVSVRENRENLAKLLSMS